MATEAVTVESASKEFEKARNDLDALIKEHHELKAQADGLEEGDGAAKTCACARLMRAMDRCCASFCRI